MSYYGYMPDQGYYVSEPATVGQLHYLMGKLYRMREAVNAAVGQVNTHERELAKLTTTVDQLIDDGKKMDERITAHDTRITRLEERVSACEAQLADILGHGYISEIRFVPDDTGVRIIADGSKHSSQHAIAVTTDDSLRVGVHQSDTGTTWALTSRGGSNDLRDLHLSGSDDALHLSRADDTLSSMHVVSSDHTIVAQASTSGQDATLDLTAGSHISDITDHQERQDRQISVLQARPTISGIHGETDEHHAIIAVSTTRADGQSSPVYRQPLILSSSDSSVTAHPTIIDGAVGFDLQAVDQLPQLPEIVVDSRHILESSEQGAIISSLMTRWDPKTRRTIDPKKTASTTIIGKDGITVSAQGTTLTVSGELAYESAKDYTDTEVRVLQDQIDTLTAQVSSLQEIVRGLQTAVSTAQHTAEMSVTSASMDVDHAPSGDPQSVQITLKLYNGRGASVAILPVELRYISPRHTINSGVQVSEHTATISNDVA